MKKIVLISALVLAILSSGGSRVVAADPFAGCSGGAINTAIGCIPTEPGALFGKFFSFGIGIAGGIAFLLILFGGFQILVSAGNPEQLAAGKELVSSAIAGLLLVIFSVFLLRVIGVDILGIPKFG
ncbi:hypothetical protein HY950_01250 [Candidatus Gottesmanbacteria bacterium]|nr:hypothetical protein [Candidatus Gottesmanbacteria bacterium]